MARVREFDEAEALTAISDVFWRKGFEGASYADLMTASGLGKGSLYAAFGDKAALYRKALAAYVESELGLLADALSGDAPPRARIQATYDYAISALEDRGDRRGCFLCNAAIDMAPHDAEVERIVTAAMDAAEAAFDAPAAEAGAPGAGAHLFAVFLGLRVMAKAGASPDAMRRARDAAMATLAAPRPLN